MARLEFISKHPVLNKCVNTITYEGDTLCHYETPRALARAIRDPYLSVELPNEPSLDADEATDEVYERTLETAMSRPPLSKALDKYNETYHRQLTLQSTNTDIDIIKEALPRLPRLKCLQMFTHEHIARKSLTFRNAYNGCLVQPEGNTGLFPCGKRQFSVLLLSALAAKTKLQEIRAGLFSWKFFEPCELTPDELKSVLRPLRRLSLVIGARDINDDADAGQVFAEKVVLARNQCLRDFLTSAPDLEVMDLTFDSYAVDEPDGVLATFAGGFVWQHLRWIGLSQVEVNEKHLLEFFRSHAQTLETLDFANLCMNSGSWNPVFRQMQASLCLERVNLVGLFLTPDSAWDMEDIVPDMGGVRLGGFLAQELMFPSHTLFDLEEVMAEPH
ncbi:hypothetical protein MMC24_007247 [Lignoscripta atroalba]|nr:hypothetical protein [Lignoscripta atroalba]